MMPHSWKQSFECITIYRIVLWREKPHAPFMHVVLQNIINGNSATLEVSQPEIISILGACWQRRLILIIRQMYVGIWTSILLKYANVFALLDFTLKLSQFFISIHDNSSYSLAFSVQESFLFILTPLTLSISKICNPSAIDSASAISFHIFSKSLLIFFYGFWIVFPCVVIFNSYVLAIPLFLVFHSKTHKYTKGYSTPNYFQNVSDDEQKNLFICRNFSF